MKNLILTSNGFIVRDNKCADYISKICNGKKILIIDNATLTGSNQKGLEAVFNNFKDITNDVTVLTLKESNIKQIYDYDYIYICGGDLMPLLDLVHQLDLSSHFSKYLRNGGVIVGESAGAIIFAFDVRYYYDIKRGTKDKYNIILKNYNGVGFIDINIFPHWDKQIDKIKQKVQNYSREHNIKIMPIEDGEYIEYSI